MADNLVDENGLKEVLSKVKTYVDNSGGGGTSYKSFSEASVDEIKEVIEKGLYRTVYHIGDTRKITLSDGYTYTARILDFDTYYQSGSLEKTHILIGLDQLLNSDYSFNSSNTNSGGWKDSLLRTNLESLYQDNKSNDIISLCVQASTYYSSSDSSTYSKVTNDHFFIPSVMEVFGPDELLNDTYWGTSISSYKCYLNEGHQWEYYKQLNPKISSPQTNSYQYNSGISKYRVSQSSIGSDGSYYYSSATYWWLRSAYLSNSSGFWGVSNDGLLSWYYAGYSFGVALCWSI